MWSLQGFQGEICNSNQFRLKPETFAGSALTASISPSSLPTSTAVVGVSAATAASPLYFFWGGAKHRDSPYI